MSTPRIFAYQAADRLTEVDQLVELRYPAADAPGITQRPGADEIARLDHMIDIKLRQAQAYALLAQTEDSA